MKLEVNFIKGANIPIKETGYIWQHLAKEMAMQIEATIDGDRLHEHGFIFTKIEEYNEMLEFTEYILTAKLVPIDFKIVQHEVVYNLPPKVNFLKRISKAIKYIFTGRPQ